MTAPAHPAPDLAAAEAVAVLMTEVTEGTLTGATMTERAADRCRQMFGSVAGSEDPLWPVQLDVARQVLGRGGIAAAELAQWLSAARSRENPSGATDCPSALVPSLSEAHSSPRGGTDGDPAADPRSVAVELDSMDTADLLTGVPIEVLAEAEAAALAVIETYRHDRGRHREDDQ
ncbi:hypothetical protein [Mycolicibacterium fortuitum]|uniref:hypothetical protein n=1 Tax=Mycolicibacterium fortuitum TaxID=1766 RepID=UPI001CE0B3BC|nr:hypothetical protein [Mycolicibacterium fortuitum]MCA4726894.1 hypothetical protein [Mycolicibacterium fortuitum]